MRVYTRRCKIAMPHTCSTTPRCRQSGRRGQLVKFSPHPLVDAHRRLYDDGGKGRGTPGGPLLVFLDAGPSSMLRICLPKFKVEWVSDRFSYNRTKQQQKRKRNISMRVRPINVGDKFSSKWDRDILGIPTCSGEQFINMHVFESPPKEPCSKWVSFEFRYGTCGARADIAAKHCPSADKDLLIAAASFSRSPDACDRAILSDPYECPCRCAD